MFVDKLKIISYALDMKKQGYQLLKNPKGTPSSIVRVIKHSKSMTSTKLDILERYERITTDFSKSVQHTTNESLNVMYYTKSFDLANQTLNRTKAVELYQMQGDKTVRLKNYKSKGSSANFETEPNWEDLHKNLYPKEVTKLSIKHSPIMPDGLELLPNMSKTVIKESLATREQEKFASGLTTPKQNFWKTLFKNLTNN